MPVIYTPQGARDALAQSLMGTFSKDLVYRPERDKFPSPVPMPSPAPIAPPPTAAPVNPVPPPPMSPPPRFNLPQTSGLPFDPNQGGGGLLEAVRRGALLGLQLARAIPAPDTLKRQQMVDYQQQLDAQSKMAQLQMAYDRMAFDQWDATQPVDTEINGSVYRRDPRTGSYSKVLDIPKPRHLVKGGDGDLYDDSTGEKIVDVPDEAGADFTLSPGSRRFDAWGNEIASAPFAEKEIPRPPAPQISGGWETYFDPATNSWQRRPAPEAPLGERAKEDRDLKKREAESLIKQREKEKEPTPPKIVGWLDEQLALLEGFLASGVDDKGNPLTEPQKAALQRQIQVYKAKRSAAMPGGVGEQAKAIIDYLRANKGK